MKCGISWLNHTETVGAVLWMGQGTWSIDYSPRYRLTPPDSQDEDARSIQLNVRQEYKKIKVGLIQKDGRWKRTHWKRLKWKPFAYLPGLPFWLFPFRKTNVVEEVRHSILSMDWTNKRAKFPSITLKPSTDRTFLSLDAGNLGTVTIEKIRAECRFKGQKPTSFEYPLASVLPKKSYPVSKVYYCRRISVDGLPCELLPWEEMEKLAQKVQEKVLTLVIFQRWKGTELLFQTPYPEVTREEILLEGKNPYSKNCPVKLQIAKSAYDSHSFIQASFEEYDTWWALEQVQIFPPILQRSSLEGSLSDCLERIEQLWKEKQIFIFINSSYQAGSLVLFDEERAMFFPIDELPTSLRRGLQEDDELPERLKIESFGVDGIVFASRLARFAAAKKALLLELADLQQEDLSLQNSLLLQNKVIALLTSEEVCSVSLEVEQRALSLPEEGIDYLKYLKKLEKILSNKTVSPRLSLKDASLLIFEFQLRCFFSERTATPPLQIDELEQFLFKRDIQLLLEGREITPPLSEGEISLLCLGEKIDSLSEKEKDRMSLPSPILSFFEDVGLSHLLLPKEMLRFSPMKEKPYICRCPDPKSPMCHSREKVEQPKDLSPPMEQDLGFKFAADVRFPSGPPLLNS